MTSRGNSNSPDESTSTPSKGFGGWLLSAFDKIVLGHPLVSMILALLFSGFFLYQFPSFKLDASSESLVLENDDDLAYSRQIADAYATAEFLIITWTPKDGMLSEASLTGLANLKKELLALDWIESITSVLDVPLLDSPRITFGQLKEGTRSIETHPDVDRSLALKEFKTSPIYKNLLVSADGKTSAIQVNIRRDQKYETLLNRRNALRNKEYAGTLTPEEQIEYQKAKAEFKAYLAIVNVQQEKNIQAVRDIMDRYRDVADLFLGGVPMITVDIIEFIRHDLITFGLGVFAFLIFALWFFFRKVRWVSLPLVCCGLTALTMIGFLGFVDWRVTVISSNFVSILIIVTMQLTIHLIVRYGELKAEFPDWDQRRLVRETVSFMTRPCFYTAITTIAAFSSLVVSGIRPVIDFGWMMTIGIVCGFILSFVLWPSIQMLLAPTKAVSDHDMTHAFTLGIARETKNHKGKILLAGAAATIWCVFGILDLKVDNRFIDYFRESTEIYQGLELIDRQLGGTTPLEVVINPEADYYEYLKELAAEKPEDQYEDPFGDGGDEFEEDEEGFDDPFQEAKPDSTVENFWFNNDKLSEIEKIHDWLTAQPEIGKVQSIATLYKVIRHLNEGDNLDDADLTILKPLLPENVKEALVDPYLSADANQARINMRIVEAHPGLHRKALIEKLERYIEEEMGYPPDRFRFTGMAILYNNMLYSLYDSQITTLGMVFVSILIMFIILFRNVKLAILALPPTVLAAGMILGLMGWFQIPLDMMTITIASITIGIGVDDTIHYIHRFQEEFAKDRDYKKAMDRTHGSIGRAIYYTSVVVTFGFSILALSNFIPTVYFGLLTGLAMVLALINNLTLLALLILTFKPLGPPSGGGNGQTA
ncbi:MAG: MMPL family transporter [Candidatus Nitronauta litoralis]|uniref:MMPL family transporter n=1 Tax=Candidatus Nitronauta litoralis TaxID=2705533 RepID=A0A7T0FZ83_9BACT|nr:MAG: MMPL family transporter [Candidatus Nitronauta litoralis]